jgi:hypothetical protein
MDPFRKSRTLSLNSAVHCKRTVGFIESAMPADGIPRGPSASNGDVGTSRLEAQL